MPEGSETAHKRDKYVLEIKAWLDCGNRSWVADDMQIDIDQGGCAMDFVMSTAKRLMAKVAATPAVEVVG